MRAITQPAEIAQTKTLRCVAYVVAHMIYRLRIEGRDHIPAKGPAILAANHVSFVDWLLLASASKRPVRFVMSHRYFRSRIFGWLFRDAKVIPIAPAHEDARMLERAFETLAEGLQDGDLVCIFPEGKLTSDGRMNPFRTGIERVLANTPVPVIPVAIDGMWGSVFSKCHASRWRWRASVHIKIGAPMLGKDITAQQVARAVARLGGWTVPPPAPDTGAPSIGAEVRPG